MRITYVIEKLSGKGGMERILTDKMNFLAEHTCHEVVLFLLWHDERPLAYPLSKEVRVVRLNVPYGLPIIGFPMLLWRFRKYIRRAHPDITIYTWVAGAFLACYGGWNGKSIFENHHTLCDMSHGFLLRQASRKVDCVVALSSNDAETFKGTQSMVVIPNFTSIRSIVVDYTSKHCLAIGRLIDVKDFPRMISLWKQVAKKHNDWILDIVGEGVRQERIKEMIDRENLQKNIVLHPATDNVVEYYLQSSIYLLTSKYEGLPMVLLEAQTCGLPIVAFDCDFGPRQIINDGSDGFLIPYNDDQTFIDKLSALMNDEKLRRNMGESARVASQRYQPAPIMAQWLQLFTSL